MHGGTIKKVYLFIANVVGNKYESTFNTDISGCLTNLMS